MIFRKIYQQNPWSLRQWRRFVCSATFPVGGGASGSVYGAQANIWTNPRKLFLLKRGQGGNSFGNMNGFGIRFTTMNQSGGVVDVPLAQTGEGIAECELLKWFVQEGDEVEEFQPLCEVQSDKATIEITSRYNGRVFKILHLPNDIVKVGETLLKMVVDEKAFCDQPSEAQDSDTSASDSGPIKLNVVGALSTPAVRNFAKQLGVDIQDVSGTGKHSRILKEDVLKYAARQGIIPKEESSSSSSSDDDECLQEDQKLPGRWAEYEDTTVLLRGFQRAMVKSMTLAAKIPHFHYVDEINCDALIELKASLQRENLDSGVKYTFLPVLIKSLSMALNKYQFVNSCFNEESQEVTLKGSHNIGIAMATPHGLVVPNIKKVQSLSIMEITKELSRLQELALTNKLTSNDISGGTITLSNIGTIGGKFGSPLINVPEVSIIAMGRIQKIPKFDQQGNVYPASIMTVNIGADHRVLDGATVAKFCNEWKLLIEKPELLMLHMR